MLHLDVKPLDINKYMVTFNATDKHLPDLIADELNNCCEKVAFAATRRPNQERPVVEMEVHLTTVCDVSDLVAQAARRQQQKIETFAQQLKAIKHKA